MQIKRLVPSMETLGLVATFLARSPPFSDMKAGTLIAAIQLQLSSGCHLCAIEDGMLAGYLGWLPITADVGDRWVRGEERLTPTDHPNAVALTIISTLSNGGTRALIREGRTLIPNLRVFFRREKSGTVKRTSVLNVRAEK